MSNPVPLRADFDAGMLRRATRDVAQGRRLLALADIYNGGSRTWSVPPERWSFLHEVGI